MTRSTQRSALMGAGIAGWLVLASMGTSAGAATTPHIRARPANVMVNHPVSLHGTGFPANTGVKLSECSRTSWVAPQQFCSTSNSRQVRTDHSGSFDTSFVMDLCPRSKPSTGPVTSRTCYVGEVEPSGVDTLVLVGAVKITVTYP